MLIVRLAHNGLGMVRVPQGMHYTRCWGIVFYFFISQSSLMGIPFSSLYFLEQSQLPFFLPL